MPGQVFFTLLLPPKADKKAKAEAKATQVSPTGGDPPSLKSRKSRYSFHLPFTSRRQSNPALPDEASSSNAQINPALIAEGSSSNAHTIPALIAEGSSSNAHTTVAAPKTLTKLEDLRALLVDIGFEAEVIDKDIIPALKANYIYSVHDLALAAWPVPPATVPTAPPAAFWRVIAPRLESHAYFVSEGIMSFSTHLSLLLSAAPTKHGLQNLLWSDITAFELAGNELRAAEKLWLQGEQPAPEEEEFEETEETDDTEDQETDEPTAAEVAEKVALNLMNQLLRACGLNSKLQQAIYDAGIRDLNHLATALRENWPDACPIEMHFKTLLLDCTQLRYEVKKQYSFMQSTELPSLFRNCPSLALLRECRLKNLELYLAEDGSIPTKLAVYRIWSQFTAVRRLIHDMRKPLGLAEALEDQFVDLRSEAIEKFKLLVPEEFPWQADLQDVLERVKSNEKKSRESSLGAHKGATAALSCIESFRQIVLLSGRAFAMDQHLRPLQDLQNCLSTLGIECPLTEKDNDSQRVLNLLDELAQAIPKTSSQSAEALVASASAGLVTYAVCMYDQDNFGRRGKLPLFDPPGNCELRKPSIPALIDERTFETTETGLLARSLVESLGFQIAMSLKRTTNVRDADAGAAAVPPAPPVPPVPPAPSASAPVAQRVGQAMVFQVRPKASFRIPRNEYRFAADASRALLAITNNHAAQEFLYTYGSHVFHDDHTLGGVHIRFCSVYGDETAGKQALETLKSKNSPGALVASFGPSCFDLDEFDKALNADNSSWCIIDRGTANSFLPIWQLAQDHSDARIRSKATYLSAAWRNLVSALPHKEDIIASLLQHEISNAESEEKDQQDQDVKLRVAALVAHTCDVRTHPAFPHIGDDIRVELLSGLLCRLATLASNSDRTFGQLVDMAFDSAAFLNFLQNSLPENDQTEVHPSIRVLVTYLLHNASVPHSDLEYKLKGKPQPLQKLRFSSATYYAKKGRAVLIQDIFDSVFTELNDNVQSLMGRFIAHLEQNSPAPTIPEPLKRTLSHFFPSQLDQLLIQPTNIAPDAIPVAESSNPLTSEPQPGSPAASDPSSSSSFDVTNTAPSGSTKYDIKDAPKMLPDMENALIALQTLLVSRFKRLIDCLDHAVRQLQAYAYLPDMGLTASSRWQNVKSLHMQKLIPASMESPINLHSIYHATISWQPLFEPSWMVKHLTITSHANYMDFFDEWTAYGGEKRLNALPAWFEHVSKQVERWDFALSLAQMCERDDSLLRGYFERTCVKRALDTSIRRLCFGVYPSDMHQYRLLPTNTLESHFYDPYDRRARRYKKAIPKLAPSTAHSSARLKRLLEHVYLATEHPIHFQSRHASDQPPLDSTGPSHQIDRFWDVLALSKDERDDFIKWMDQHWMNNVTSTQWNFAHKLLDDSTSNVLHEGKWRSILLKEPGFEAHSLYFDVACLLGLYGFAVKESCCVQIFCQALYPTEHKNLQIQELVVFKINPEAPFDRRLSLLWEVNEHRHASWYRLHYTSSPLLQSVSNVNTAIASSASAERVPATTTFDSASPQSQPATKIVKDHVKELEQQTQLTLTNSLKTSGSSTTLYRPASRASSTGASKPNGDKARLPVKVTGSTSDIKPPNDSPPDSQQISPQSPASPKPKDKDTTSTSSGEEHDDSDPENSGIVDIKIVDGEEHQESDEDYQDAVLDAKDTSSSPSPYSEPHPEHGQDATQPLIPEPPQEPLKQPKEPSQEAEKPKSKKSRWPFGK